MPQPVYSGLQYPVVLICSVLMHEIHYRPNYFSVRYRIAFASFGPRPASAHFGPRSARARGPCWGSGLLPLEEPGPAALAGARALSPPCSLVSHTLLPFRLKEIPQMRYDRKGQGCFLLPERNT